jgi:hypothetical protein
MFVNLNIVSATASHQITTGHPKRDRKENAEDNDLEDVAIGHRLDDRLGHRVQEDLIPGLRRRGDFRLLPDRQIDTNAGLHDVDGDETDDERQRRDDLEVDDRAQAHATDHLDVPGAGNSCDQRREDQRRDDHLDQAQEDLTEGAEIDGRGRVVLAHQVAGNDADREPDEDLLGERRPAAWRRRRVIGMRHS